MKLQSLIVVSIIIFSLFLSSPTYRVESQGPLVKCGDVITGEFKKDEWVQYYHIVRQPGDMFGVYGEVTEANYRDLKIRVWITAPNGFVIHDGSQYSFSYFDYGGTDEVSDKGNYKIGIEASTKTGGQYTLYIGCIQSGGKIIGAGNLYQEIKCGSIIENKFKRDGDYHLYLINMTLGDILRISAEVSGNYQDLKIKMGINSVKGIMIRKGADYSPETSIAIETLKLPDTGVYAITVQGYARTGGQYTVYVGCTHEGKVIQPGDIPETAAQPTTQPISGTKQAEPGFSGVGFPGLPSVDFSQMTELSLPSEGKIGGKIKPTGNDVLGFTLSAKAGDVLNLNFTRTAGNVNLGLAVLSPDNKVVFFSALVTSESLTTRLKLPAEGQYTIGIFRVDLMPPNKPETTEFKVEAKLNP